MLMMFRRLNGDARVAAGARFRGVPDETAELDPLGAMAAEGTAPGAAPAAPYFPIIIIQQLKANVNPFL